MNSTRITEALTADCRTRSMLIGVGVLPRVAELFRENFGEQRAIIVADATTFSVAGHAVVEHLQQAGLTLEAPFIFPDPATLHADYERVTELRATLCQTPAIAVAVGSGTINDITKLASHECGKPYMVVATAASMDGYVAFGAAITLDGFKQTISCPAPQAMLADAAILAAAPTPMTASGYADLLGKVTAGADWILADAIGVEPIMAQAWNLVQPNLRKWIGRPAELQAGNLSAAEDLIEGLVMGGIAMQISQSSRPASGSEHQFSHLWEMEGLALNGTPVSHGFKVGLGSLAIAALYEWLLKQDLKELDFGMRCAAWPTRAALEQEVRSAHPIPFLADKAVDMTLAKHLEPQDLAERLRQLQQQWPSLRERLQAQLLPAGQLRGLLRSAGCPTAPSEIGLTRAALKETFRRARQIRSRYTVLDVMWETGYLDTAVEALFAPGGFFGAE